MSGICTHPFKAPFLRHQSLVHFTEEEATAHRGYTHGYMISTSGLCSYQAPCTTLNFSDFKGVALTHLPAPTSKQRCDQGWGSGSILRPTPQLRYDTPVSLNRRQTPPLLTVPPNTAPKGLLAGVIIPRFPSPSSEFG